jgi:DNA-binding NarL/FixJ family response regulator
LVSEGLRVELVDDHEVVRQGVRALLDAEPDITVVGEAGSVEEAIRRVGFDDPDVVILDVRLPDGSGVEACREIRSRWPKVKVLMLTSFADDEALFASIMAGASGYVLKQIKGNDLVESVRKVGRGESLLDPEMTDRVFRRIRGEEADDPLLSRLSKQERKILDYIAAGLTNRQIAEEMFLAEKTVKNYVSNVLAKLEMSRRSEAAAYAARIDAEKEHRYPPEQWPQ